MDTEHLLYQVRNSYEIVPEEEVRPVDVQLINTCGFIGDAKEQSIQTILASVQRKKNGEIGRLLVFGCLSQRYSREMPELIPEVDGWFGARDLDPSWDQDDALVNQLYETILTRPYYAAYLADPEISLAQDIRIFKKIFENEFEDNDANPGSSL